MKNMYIFIYLKWQLIGWHRNLQVCNLKSGIFANGVTNIFKTKQKKYEFNMNFCYVNVMYYENVFKRKSDVNVYYE